MVNYAKDGEKTEQELFCQGINCTPVIAVSSLSLSKSSLTRRTASKPTTVISASRKQTSRRSLPNRSEWSLLKKMWGDRFQVLVTTPEYRPPALPLCCQPVSFKDGKRIQNKEKAWWYFRHIADKGFLGTRTVHCAESGSLSVSTHPHPKGQGRYAYPLQLARSAIDEAISMSHNLRQLEYHLSEMGCTLGSNPRQNTGRSKARATNAPSDCTGWVTSTPRSASRSGSLKTGITSALNRSSPRPTNQSNTGSEHGVTELQRSAACMGCTSITATDSAICRSTRQDNRITQEFTTFSKGIC